MDQVEALVELADEGYNRSESLAIEEDIASAHAGNFKVFTRTGTHVLDMMAVPEKRRNSEVLYLSPGWVSVRAFIGQVKSEIPPPEPGMPPHPVQLPTAIVHEP